MEEKECKCEDEECIGKIHISKREIKKMQEKLKRVEELKKNITKAFKKDKFVQNEYWEEDGNGDGVLCASFLNIELDQISAFFEEE
jgi:hypothetical protein